MMVVGSGMWLAIDPAPRDQARADRDRLMESPDPLKEGP